MRKLTDSERVYRAAQLSEAYIPYLRELYPLSGRVVAINLLTAEYVVGEHSPDAIDLYVDKFGDTANIYIEPVYGMEWRPIEEQLEALYASRWYKERHSDDRGK